MGVGTPILLPPHFSVTTSDWTDLEIITNIPPMSHFSLVTSVSRRLREFPFVEIKTLSLYTHRFTSAYKLLLFVKKIFLEIFEIKDIEMFGITFYLLCD